MAFGEKVRQYIFKIYQGVGDWLWDIRDFDRSDYSDYSEQCREGLYPPSRRG